VGPPTSSPAKSMTLTTPTPRQRRRERSACPLRRREGAGTRTVGACSPWRALAGSLAVGCCSPRTGTPRPAQSVCLPSFRPRANW
jgi:hypothetical protein